MEVNTNEIISQTRMRSTNLAKPQVNHMIKIYISVLKLGIVTPNLLMAVIGMWLAASGAKGFISLPIETILFTIIGTFMILASGTSFNNYFDRDIDQLMKRTQHRVLVEGKIPAHHVFWLSMVMLLAGIAFLSAINLTTAIIALIGWIGYSIVYTIWFKRKHWMNTIVGSFSGAVPPVIGWAAVSGHVGAGAVALFMIMFLWQPPHFYAIAIRRKEEYKRAGIPMLPVVKGFEKTKKHIIGTIILLIPASILLYFYTSMNLFYIFISITLGLGWLFQARWGRGKEYKETDTIHWARKNFIYSLIYLVTLMIGMFIGAF